MLIVPARAKLNLALEIIARRSDGWHDIDSVLAPIDWHDLVGIQLRPATSGEAAVSLRLTGPAARGVPDDDRNAAVRAAHALRELAGVPITVALWLDKHVPHAAGLGGGSADAAAVLRAGVRLLRLCVGVAVAEDRLSGAALHIGSDVPAMLAGGVQRVRGLGERLQRLRNVPMHAVVAVAGSSSTAAVYRALSSAELRADGRAERVARSLDERVVPDQSLLGSGLEPAAARVAPELAAALRALRSQDPGRRWNLTGSGGAAFCLAGDGSEAQEIAARLAAIGMQARACCTVPT